LTRRDERFQVVLDETIRCENLIEKKFFHELYPGLMEISSYGESFVEVLDFTWGVRRNLQNCSSIFGEQFSGLPSDSIYLLLLRQVCARLLRENIRPSSLLILMGQ
jgi:hypothetical protein